MVLVRALFMLFNISKTVEVYRIGGSVHTPRCVLSHDALSLVVQTRAGVRFVCDGG